MSETGLLPNKSLTVCVLHASVGSGHKTAAEAIAQAVASLRDYCAQHFPAFPGNVNVQVFDILDFGRIHFNGDKTASLFTGPTRPVYDITWRYFLTGRLLWGGGTIWARLMFPEFTKWVRENKPDVVIATHITAANVAISSRMITRQHYPVVCVPTDYEVEGMWPHRYTDLFCVGTESMAETLRARKVDDARILVTGLPARADFKIGYDRDAIRAEWNIPASQRVAIVIAGASLPQPYVLFREILDKALPVLRELQSHYFVFLAGKDEDYAQRLKTRLKEEGVGNAVVLGYTNQVAKLMAASDFAICKAGGLTVTECLCAETPMLLVGRAYGQEKVNVQLLTSVGSALHVQTAHELTVALRRLTGSPDGLKAMRLNEEYLRKPDAASQIAIASLQLAAEPLSDAVRERRSHHPFISFYWGHQPAHTR